MADEADIGNAVADLFLANALKAQQGKLNQATIHYVECCWCQDYTENGARFCSPECRSDYEKHEIAQSRNNGRSQS